MITKIIVVLICIFLMFSDAENLLICLWVSPISSLEKNVSLDLLPIFILFTCFFDVELHEFSAYYV